MELVQENVEIETLTQKQFNKLQEKRWSPRSFKDKEISRDEILQIFDAGRKAPSSYNEQPWRFLLLSKDDENYDKLFDCMVEFNQSWVGNAHYLAVSFGKKYFSREKSEKKPNRHYMYDVGVFMYGATLMAATMNLYIHQMAGFSPEKVLENFSISSDYEPISMFVIGELGDGTDLTEELEEKESPYSSRKSLNEFLFSNEWEKPF